MPVQAQAARAIAPAAALPVKRAAGPLVEQPEQSQAAACEPTQPAIACNISEPVTHDSELHANLIAMFPNLDSEVIAAALRSTGTVEEAINQLLQPYSFSHTPQQAAMPTSGAKSHQGFTIVEFSANSQNSKWMRTSRRLQGTVTHAVEAARAKVVNHGARRYGKVL